MKKFAKNFCAAVFLLAVFCSPSRAAGAIEFEYSDAVSADAASLFAVPEFPKLDEAKYKGGGYLIRDFSVPLKSGDAYRLMLLCSSVDRDGGVRGIGILVADERREPAARIQNINLGDGYAPQIVTAGDEISGGFMFRVIRAGNNTEARVYSVNPVTGRLAETFTIDRGLPAKRHLDIEAKLLDGGFVEIARKGAAPEKADLSAMLDALIEDEIYQEDGRPVAALENLRLVRGGWEDEAFYSSGGKTRLDAGLSLVTLSKKPVVDVTVVFEREQNDSWSAVSYAYGPSLPYRSE